MDLSRHGSLNKGLYGCPGLPAAQPSHQALSKKTPMLWGNLGMTQRHTGRIEHAALQEGEVVGPLPSSYLSSATVTYTITTPTSTPVELAPWNTLG